MNTNVQNSASGNSAAADIAALVGRILLALIFIIAGFEKIAGYAATAGYMAGKGMSMVNIFLPLTILVELGGGLLIALGWKARWSAAAIFLFLIPVTLMFHNPIGLAPGAAEEQMIHLLKNVSIMGGMLGLFAFGPGGFSFDARKTA
jgi:putative oxidoreductase